MSSRSRTALLVGAMATLGLVLLAVWPSLDGLAGGEAVSTSKEGRLTPPRDQGRAGEIVSEQSPVLLVGSPDRRIEIDSEVARLEEANSPLVTLRVKVVDSAGTPKPDAIVDYSHTPKGGAPWSASREDLRQLAPDENGELILELPPGLVLLSAWTEGSASRFALEELEPGGDREVELRLLATVVIEGLVLDAVTGAPVAGAEVYTETFDILHRTASGPDGAFRLEHFPVGASGGFVRCNAPRYGTESMGLTVLENGSWSVDEPGPGAPPGYLHWEGRPRIDFNLVPARSIVGQVRNLQGSPVAGAKVRARGAFWIASNLAMKDEASAETDEQGAFRLTPLRSDISHTFKVEADGLAARKIEIPPSAALTSDLGTIVMEPERVVLVTVMGVDARPVQGAKVELGIAEAQSTDEEEQGGVAYPRSARVEVGPIARETDPMGIAIIEGLPPATYDLVVRMERKEIARRELDLVSPPYATDVLVELPPEYTTIEGRVLLSGEPTSGVEVSLSRTSRKVSTDSAGNFVLTGVDMSFPRYSLTAVWRNANNEMWTADAQVELGDFQGPVRMDLERFDDGVK